MYKPIKFEPAYSKTYNKTYATSKDSDQPSMARVLVHPSMDSPEAIKAYVISEDWSDCADTQADLFLRWLDKIYCRFCHVLAHLVLFVCSSWGLTHCRLNRLSHSIYWKSNFNFRYARLGYLHIPREKWLNYLQTVETLIRRHVLRHLIWVCTVCQLPFYGSPDYNGLITL